MRMIIVDDDASITSALANLCDYSGLGIDEAVCFNSGIDAYKYMKDNAADILIVDIKMPVMSGFELAGRALELNQSLKIIILSGYDDFEYAHNAIQLGVVDYQLKPFSAEAMLESIKKAVLEVRRDEERICLRQKSELKLKVYQEYEKQLFFLNLEKECRNGAEKLQEKIRGFGVANPQEKCVVINIGMAQSGTVNEYDISILQNTVNEALDKSISHKFFDGICGDELIVVIFGYRSLRRVRDEIQSCISVLHNSLSLECCAGIGKAADSVNGIYESFLTAKQVYEHMVFYDDNFGTVMYSEHRGRDEYPKEFERAITEQLGSADNFQLGAKNEISKYFQSINTKTEKNVLIENCCNIMSVLAKRISAMEISSAEEYNLAYWLKKSSGIMRLSELEDFMVKGVELLNNELNKAKLSRNDYKIEKIKEYISNNIGQNISLVSLARMVDLSPGYLAVLFREKLGQNFSEYIINERIRKAKSLLCNTGKKIGEIAKLIGYEDQRYFSEVFKQHTGMKPSEYRREFGK